MARRCSEHLGTSSKEVHDIDLLNEGEKYMYTCTPEYIYIYIYIYILLNKIMHNSAVCVRVRVCKGV